MERLLRCFARVVIILFVSTVMNAGQEKIHPALQEVLVSSPPTTQIAINILLTNRLSVDDLLDLTRGMGKKERRAAVVRALQDHAEATQPRVRAMLATAAALGQATEPKVIWMINTIHTTATASVIGSLAALEEVEWIYYDAEQSGDEVRDGAGIPLGGNSIMTRNAGLNLIRAVQAWGLGYKGEGIVVGNIDSGTDYTHPDLANHFYINPGEDLNHNGRYDPTDINSIDDDHNGYVDDIRGWDFGSNDNDATYNTESHGVYTSGLVVGDGTNGDSTGVAPGAKMIPLKTYSATGSSTESNNWLAMQYSVMMGADITTSSLSWKWAFSPKPMYHMWRAMSDMEYAAGVLHTNSIGNQGGSSSYPIPYNISTPGSSPPPWFHKDQVVIGRLSSTLGCGDVNATTDIITSTSGRGPSAWEDIQIAHPEYPYVQPEIYRDYPWETITPRGRALIKPDVSSPGAGTTSTAPGGGYGSFSGTSGATPHVAGTAALVLSANNSLLAEHVAQILMTTGVEKGAPGKDTLYGAGRIDAYNAVYAARHAVTGTIRDSATGAPLPYAKVFVPEMSYTFSTDAGGRYIIFSKVDTITMAVNAFAHTPKTTRIFIPNSTTPLTIDFSLAATTTITVSGTVRRLVDSSAVQGRLRVFVDSSSTINPVRTALLDGNGQYSMSLYPGRYRFQLEPSAPYLPSSIPAVTLAAADSVMNFFVGTADVLLVDDDEGDGQQMFYKLALQANGKTFYTWDVSRDGTPPTSAFENLKTPKLVFWLTGNEDTLALTNAEFASIFSFVGGAGRRGLLLSGQNMAQFADSANLAALAGVRRGGTSTELTVRGATGDSVSNGMVMNTTGGNGSGNQTSRDVLLLTPGSNAVPFLLYGSSSNDIAGVRRYSGNTRLAFLGFGLESVPNNQGTTTRSAFLNSLVTWFTVGASTDVRYTAGNPVAYRLEQNYPNPFNPITTIRYSVPATARVALKVFDILGREVETLVDDLQTSGSYSISYDARNLSSGVYFYRLQTADFSQTKKFLLVK